LQEILLEKLLVNADLHRNLIQVVK